MIRELLDFCLTPASSSARKSGHLYESIAFEARSRRNQEAWLSHWLQCHDLTRKFLTQHPAAKSLTLLGSGSLFEVPREDFSGRLERLVLVDRVFPRSVRRWVKANEKVIRIELLELNLTDAALNAQTLLKKVETDLIISANLLSQLAIHEAEPRRKLEIEKHHLDCLESFRHRALLWTDVKRQYRQVKTLNILNEEATVLTKMGPPEREWNWEIAPAPEWRRDVDLVLQMQAFFL